LKCSGEMLSARDDDDDDRKVGNVVFKGKRSADPRSNEHVGARDTTVKNTMVGKEQLDLCTDF